MRFDSPFDERLDDYATEFYLWPVTDEELADDLVVWQAFAGWRARFDAGDAPPPFEGRGPTTWPPEPPRTARRAVPEWRLDDRRSFSGGIPRHKVRWRFLDQAQDG